MNGLPESILLPEPFDGERLLCTGGFGLTIEVRENSDWRWLLFHDDGAPAIPGGNFPIQSMMFRPRPEYLALPYMQAMLSSLCVGEFPAQGNVLQLGLGSGAINRFLRHYYPEITLRTVELSAALVDIYRQYFYAEKALVVDADADGDGDGDREGGLRSITSSEQITVLDAEVYFETDQSAKTNDLIICDLYGADGLPHFMQHTRFYSQLAEALSETGVVVINTGVRDVNVLQNIFNGLRAVFNSLLIAEVAGFENIILYASNGHLHADPKQIVKLQCFIELDISQHFNQAKSFSEDI